MNKINQAVILCGGKGERLRPLTQSTPKPMIKIDNRPFLEFLIKKISSQGINRFVILSGYLGDQIKDYCESKAFDYNPHFLTLVATSLNLVIMKFKEIRQFNKAEGFTAFGIFVATNNTSPDA